MGLVVMSEAELQRVEVLGDICAGRMRVNDAAAVLGISRRQVFRLWRMWRAQGAPGLASKRRGRASNRRYGNDVRAQALSLMRAHYANFGPTLAAEKLAEEHGLPLSRETLRQWMLADGLWLDRKTRRRPVHQPRPRREHPYAPARFRRLGRRDGPADEQRNPLDDISILRHQ
jgi:hypothetical protein